MNAKYRFRSGESPEFANSCGGGGDGVAEADEEEDARRSGGLNYRLLLTLLPDTNSHTHTHTQSISTRVFPRDASLMRLSRSPLFLSRNFSRPRRACADAYISRITFNITSRRSGGRRAHRKVGEKGRRAGLDDNDGREFPRRGSDYNFKSSLPESPESQRRGWTKRPGGAAARESQRFSSY